tara:strand:+ start:118 stop:474 length:357 start_codon:yes stop_codon:yes gene_type:complete
MGNVQKKFQLEDQEFSRISSFLKHANKLFSTSNFIKNLDTLELIIFIYKENHLENKNINFKVLKEYTNKSDMYLSSFLKSGKETNYLNFKISSKDKRIKNYYLEKNSYEFIGRLKVFN